MSNTTTATAVEERQRLATATGAAMALAAASLAFSAWSLASARQAAGLDAAIDYATAAAGALAFVLYGYAMIVALRRQDALAPATPAEEPATPEPGQRRPETYVSATPGQEEPATARHAGSATAAATVSANPHASRAAARQAARQYASATAATETPIKEARQKRRRPDAPPPANFERAAANMFSAAQAATAGDRSAMMDDAAAIDEQAAAALRDIYATVEIVASQAQDAVSAVKAYALEHGLEAYQVAGRLVLWDGRRRRVYATTIKRERPKKAAANRRRFALPWRR